MWVEFVVGYLSGYKRFFSRHSVFFPLLKNKHQPRSQLSSAISDATSPVKLVGKIRLGRYRARFQASSGHSDSANRPGYEAEQTLLNFNSTVQNVAPKSRFLFVNGSLVWNDFRAGAKAVWYSVNIPLVGYSTSTIRDGPLETLWGGRGIFEPQEFFFVNKFLV